jgi:hypothetical protein
MVASPEFWIIAPPAAAVTVAGHVRPYGAAGAIEHHHPSGRRTAYKSIKAVIAVSAGKKLDTSFGGG